MRLCILAFDMRASFTRGMLGIESLSLTPEQLLRVRELKGLIYNGFIEALADGLPVAEAGILVDEEGGEKILEEARGKGFTTILTVEKNGSVEFEYEYGLAYKEHIERFSPTYAKIKVAYNPAGKALTNDEWARLVELSNYCLASKRKLLIEPLVPHTPDQLIQAQGDKNRYMDEIRPNLIRQVIADFQTHGVEADIWKIEGCIRTADYEAIAAQGVAGGRQHVRLIVLGGGGSEKRVEEWLEASKGVPYMAGFAIGRTITWEPLQKYVGGEYNAAQAVSEISRRYRHFYNLYTTIKTPSYS